MGILLECQDLVRGLKLPQGFAVVELGNQFCSGTTPRKVSSKFYKELGAGRYMSIDGNGQDGARAFDLNLPVPVEFHAVFDLVTDFGTGEHVFDQSQVWKTIHQLVKPGGHIVFDRPTAGYPGHCFYLIQPNLIAAIAHANGYVIKHFSHFVTGRGALIRGVMAVPNKKKPFQVPQQGRYFNDLAPIMDTNARDRGPDYKSKHLRQTGVVTRARPHYLAEFGQTVEGQEGQ